MTMYFQPMATGYFKIYSSPFEHFWCCTGTGMESFTKLNDSIYFHKDDELYVTQLISSTLDWRQKQVKLYTGLNRPDSRSSDAKRSRLKINQAKGFQAPYSRSVLGKREY